MMDFMGTQVPLGLIISSQSTLLWETLTRVALSLLPRQSGNEYLRHIHVFESLYFGVHGE